MKTLVVEKACNCCGNILPVKMYYSRFGTCIECCKTKRKLERTRLKVEVLTHYSKSAKLQCECCKEDILEFLSIDHIHGGGGKHRQQTVNSGGSNFYRWLRKQNYPSGYRVLCHNCNQAIGAFGKCPHKSL